VSKKGIGGKKKETQARGVSSERGGGLRYFVRPDKEGGRTGEAGGGGAENNGKKGELWWAGKRRERKGE